MKKRHKQKDEQVHEEPEVFRGPVESEGLSSVEKTAQDLLECRSQLQRLGADYQNYQKRALRQIQEAGQFSQEAMTRSLLPALDNFAHTLEKGREFQDIDSLLKGVQIVYDHLIQTLQSLGLKRIEVQPGQDFNPVLHEAMMHEETDEYPANTIVRELSFGYTMNERTLRPARVSVAKGVVKHNEEKISEEEDVQE